MTISEYHKALTSKEKKICNLLRSEIDTNLKGAESKVWHAHPVWFLDGNPIVGYGKQKAGIKLMFWSGADFNEKDFVPGTGKFKDASITYTDVTEVDTKSLKRWLKKGREIQWDYKNIVKRKGKLIRRA